MHKKKLYTWKRTCLISLMLNFFISEGNFTESRMGFDAGPEYGGPCTFSSAMRRDEMSRAFCGLFVGAKAET